MSVEHEQKCKTTSYDKLVLNDWNEIERERVRVRTHPDRNFS